jgi:hypothetical protein
MDVPRNSKGQLMKGHHLSPETQWKPGQPGNPRGTNHAAKCQKLIESHKLDEEIALMAGRERRYKRVPFQVQLNAYETLVERGYGRPAVIQIANVNEVQFVKRLVGIDEADI